MHSKKPETWTTKDMVKIEKKLQRIIQLKNQKNNKKLIIYSTKS